MKRQEITITITSDGAATVAVAGVAGPSCEALTQDLERALGATREKRRTPEYYQTAPTTTVTPKPTTGC